MSWFTRRGLELVPEDLLGWGGWLDEMKAAQLNLLILHVSRNMSELVDYAATDHYAALARQAERYGIDIEWAPHALKELLPREYFAEHPEWFRMNTAGLRTPDYNMCITQPAAQEALRANAARMAKVLTPTTDRYYFWSDDGRPWCECPSCAGLSQGDQSMLFTNIVLEGIRTVIPGAKLSGLAYLNSLEPLQEIKPAEGVFLEYAPIRRSFHYALNDPASAINRVEHRNLLNILPSYGGVRPDSQVLEYWLDESLFWRAADRPTPPPKLPFFPEVLTNDLQLYADLGFRSIVTHAVLLGKEYRDAHGTPPIQAFGDALQAVKAPQTATA
jgi:hypothetical protein